MDKIRVVNDKKVHMKYVKERVEREKYEEQEEERTEGQKKNRNGKCLYCKDDKLST